MDMARLALPWEEEDFPGVGEVKSNAEVTAQHTCSCVLRDAHTAASGLLWAHAGNGAGTPAGPAPPAGQPQRLPSPSGPVTTGPPPRVWTVHQGR